MGRTYSYSLDERNRLTQSTAWAALWKVLLATRSGGASAKTEVGNTVSYLYDRLGLA